jgi:DNA-binding transcriptional MocR family regulator
MPSSPHDFRYRQIADDLEDSILKGIYAPGDKLPSIRELHRRLEVSITTAYHACVELETRGLVEARPKCGYYVSPAPLVVPAATSAPEPPENPRKVEATGMVNAVLKAVSDPKMIPLGSSATSADLLPHRKFSRIIKSLGANDIRKVMGYSLTEGHPELRRQLALRSVGELPGISPDDFVITTGCMEAVTLCLQAVLKPGDTLAIETPTHFGFLQLFKELGILVLELPTHPKTGMDMDALEKNLRTSSVQACLFMPNIHNPLGTLLSEEKKERLVTLLNHHEVPVIEDDINAELFFTGHRRPTLLKAYDQKDLVPTCSSFSKTLAPGFRIGWALPGKRFRDRVLRLKAGSTVCSAGLDQEVMARYLSGGAVDRHMRTLRNAVKAQVLKTALAVRKYFPEGTGFSFPEGGSLLWVALPEGTDGMTVYRNALKQNISTLPGVVCSVSGVFTNYIRIGCGHPFTDEMERAMEVLGGLVEDET